MQTVVQQAFELNRRELSLQRFLASAMRQVVEPLQQSAAGPIATEIAPVTMATQREPCCCSGIEASQTMAIVNDQAGASDSFSRPDRSLRC